MGLAGMQGPHGMQGVPGDLPYGQQVQGSVSGWKAEWGWVTYMGVDFFAHKSEFVTPIDELNPPATGSMVCFTVAKDAKSGKNRAVGIRLLGGGTGFGGGGVGGGVQS